jgi:glycosyltransferase involved in cell wall biosynthesis
MKFLRLAIVSTHAIQYYSPIFQALERSERIRPRVFYTWSQTAAAPVADPGFSRAITWDIPLLEGYEWEFVPNVAARPGTEHFRGLRNPRLVSSIQAWGADAVLVFGWNLESHLQAMRQLKGRIPVFFRGDSTLLQRRSWWRTAARRVFLRWIYRHIDVAISVGTNNRDYYRWCGVPERRIAFAPHAIDTRRFADPDGQHERRAAQWREELGIATHERVLVFAAKMTPTKSPMLLLDAFVESGAPGHLLMVGNGALESELRARVRGRRDVHFLPFQNQSAMPAVYRLGDVFVLPSQGETWGLAVNEAMACGRPVIVSNQVGCARDLLPDAAAGWVFPSGDRKQLAGVIRQALQSDEQTLRAMGTAAQHESERWSTDAAAKAIEDAVVTFSEARP